MINSLFQKEWLLRWSRMKDCPLVTALRISVKIMSIHFLLFDMYFDCRLYFVYSSKQEKHL